MPLQHTPHDPPSWIASLINYDTYINISHILCLNQLSCNATYFCVCFFFSSLYLTFFIQSYFLLRPNRQNAEREREIKKKKRRHILLLSKHDVISHYLSAQAHSDKTHMTILHANTSVFRIRITVWRNRRKNLIDLIDMNGKGTWQQPELHEMYCCCSHILDSKSVWIYQFFFVLQFFFLCVCISFSRLFRV